MRGIMDTVVFLVLNELPLRGALDAVGDRDKKGCGLFLSLFDYTLTQNKELATIYSTIPQNATYVSHDIQNEVIELMARIVTEESVKDIGDAWYTLKVDGTKDPTGRENISIIIRYVDSECRVHERLLAMLTTDRCDAQSLADSVLTELERVGLDTAKMLSQCYDGASVMSGKDGGMQRIIQDRLHRQIPYIHCFNHQLHLVIVHALTSEDAVESFFDVCNTLYKFLRKPTVAAQYTGQSLKRLLEQRWTGHLNTVSLVVKSHASLAGFLTELRSRKITAEVRIEASGLHNAITEPSFLFLARLLLKVLGLMDPPNKMLQAENCDLLTAVQLIHNSTECLRRLRCDEEFQNIWAETASDGPTPAKRLRQAPAALREYVVEETLGHQEEFNEQEGKQLFFAIIDSVLGEMAARFSETNQKYTIALKALDPASEDFLNTQKLKPLLDLSHTEINDTQFIIAREFVRSQGGEPMTISELVTKHRTVFTAMPQVFAAFKQAMTFGASTAMCENSFSTLKRVFSDHRRSMLHGRKANLIRLAFENDLTRKFNGEWREVLLRRFNAASNRRLQLY